MESEKGPPEEKPDFMILVSDAFPSGFEDDLVAELDASDAKAGSFRISAGPYAGLELYLPTAVALFIASSYFSGAFQKIGEEHYEIVKRVAKRLYQRISGVRVTPIGTPGKVSPIRKYSLTYSIVAEIAPRLNFKLILYTEISNEEAERGVSAFLGLIRDIHFDILDPQDLESLLTYRPVGGTVLVTFDAKAGRIVPVDPSD